MIADTSNQVLVSAVSLWEIAIKVRIGKLDADVNAVVRAAAGDFTILQVSPAHLAALMRLPFFGDHRDPFDHLLVAQASAEEACFISEDRNVPRYSVRFATCSDPATPTDEPAAR